jgi:5-(hydroxymethyl)furfural/furfural oxidase
MHMAIVSKSAWHQVGQRLGTLFVWVNKAYSRGEVRLASANPMSEPDVDFRLLSDTRDRQRLADGIRLAAKIFADPAMRGVCDLAFPAAFSDRVRSVSTPTTRNALQAALFGFMLDLAGPLRARLVRDVITGGVTLDALLNDDQRMDDFLTLAAGGVWHPSGTCRMGLVDDPMAVSDAQGRVYGVEGLRVADASLMPTIPCANTNMPTIMMAERLSDLIAQRN